MTQIAGPEALPDTMRRFADREGGVMWRQRKLPTFVLKKMIAVDQGVSRMVTLTASRTFSKLSGQITGTQYDWEEADQRTAQGAELPDYVVDAVEMSHDVRHNPANIFHISENKTVGLYIPDDKVNDITGQLLVSQCVQYSLDGDIFCELPVIGGEVVRDCDDGEIEPIRGEAAYGLQIVQLQLPGRESSIDTELDELDILIHGNGPAALVSKCSEQMLGMMEFLRPPAYGDEGAA